MSLPLLLVLFAAMAAVAFLAGVEPWMIGLGAVVAVVGYLLERRQG